MTVSLPEGRTFELRHLKQSRALGPGGDLKYQPSHL